jgi:hypothetical protein
MGLALGLAAEDVAPLDVHEVALGFLAQKLLQAASMVAMDSSCLLASPKVEDVIGDVCGDLQDRLLTPRTYDGEDSLSGKEQQGRLGVIVLVQYQPFVIPAADVDLSEVEIEAVALGHSVMCLGRDAQTVFLDVDNKS